MFRRTLVGLILVLTTATTVRAQLVVMMKEALPKDPVIQSLTAHHYRTEWMKRR